jgi:hypothetical protein
LAFISQLGKSRDFWLKDLASGVTQKLTNGLPGEYPLISPDGSKVVFVNTSPWKLIILDVTSGNLSSIEGENSSRFNYLTWSRDSKHLSYVSTLTDRSSHERIFLADVELLNIRPITSIDGNIYNQSWDFDSERIVFFRNSYEQSTGRWSGAIWTTDVAGSERFISYIDKPVQQFVWVETGVLNVYCYDDYSTLYLKGLFKFDSTALNAGNNVFYAVATDDAGNQSNPSESISVRKEAASIDLSINANDIRVYPHYPKPGENVIISATIRNLGESPVADAEVAVYLWDSSGKITQLHGTTLSTLAPGDTATVNVATKAPEQFGRNTIFVIVDPSDKITERSEDNNYAEKEFVVTDKEEIVFATKLSTNQITSKQNLQVDVTLNNSGQSRGAELEVRILDGNGVQVAVLSSTVFELRYGSQTLTNTWNTGDVFAGEYRVQTVLRVGQEAPTEDLQKFDILPDLLVQPKLQTDKAAYETGEDVRVSAKVANAGVNFLIPEISVQIAILAPDQNELTRAETIVRNLMPGMHIEVPLAWNVALAVPGDYVVQMTAAVGGQIVAQENIGFKILDKPVLSGRIGLEADVVPIGRPISVGYSLVNSGNAAASGSVRVAVIDTESGALVAEQERVVALMAGETVAGILEFAGDKFELKTYRITLRYSGQGEQKMLGETVLMIVDGTPPEIIILRPQAGETYAGMVKIEAEASDNASGVARLEYRIDEREWLEMPFFEATTGRHWASWEPTFQDGGEHKIRLRAVDRAGNSAETAAVAFEVQMDKVPPVTEITIGDPKLVSGEDVFVSDKTSFTLNATADSGSVARTEYRIDQGAWQIYASPFALADLADGEHTLRYRSADNAGNIEDEQALKVLIDSTPPQTSLGFQEGYMDGGRLLVSPQTEITLAATDNLTGVARTQYRFDEEASWSNYFGAFGLADLPYGVHTLHYRSVDRVENEEAENSVIITLFGVEVATELLHRPRVLVWTEDPAEINGNSRPAWTLEEVRALIAEALGVPDPYFSLTTAKEDFRQAFRSGIFNVTIIIRQDIPLDTVFLREMREAVQRGAGLLVSAWGNSVPPLWQDIFGVDFKGSLSMEESGRSLHLYAGPLGDEQTLTASGRVLKTTLDGGTLGGIVLGESACEGVRGLTLHYPLTIQPGDRLTATLFAPRGKKSILVEEETLTVGELPVGPVSRFTGNAAGDLVIAAVTAEGVDLAST